MPSPDKTFAVTRSCRPTCTICKDAARAVVQMHPDSPITHGYIIYVSVYACEECLVLALRKVREER